MELCANQERLQRQHCYVILVNIKVLKKAPWAYRDVHAQQPQQKLQLTLE